MGVRLVALAILVPLIYGENTSDQQAAIAPSNNCSQQIDAWQSCQVKDLPRSADGKLMKEKIDGIYEKCAGTMPRNCTTFWRTADECFHQEMNKADTDPQNNNTKRQVLQMIDQCYQRMPNDPFADLFEELYPEMLLFDDGGLKAQQQLSFAGRKFVPPPQCAPTIENLQCVSKEMASLAKDPEAIRASDSLRRLKSACKDKLTSQCTPQTPPLWMCLDRAMKQLTHQTEDAVQKCMQHKGFVIVTRQAVPAQGGANFGVPTWGQSGQPMAGPPNAGFGFGGPPPFSNGNIGAQSQSRASYWSFE